MQLKTILVKILEIFFCFFIIIFDCTFCFAQDDKSLIDKDLEEIKLETPEEDFIQIKKPFRLFEDKIQYTFKTGIVKDIEMIGAYKGGFDFTGDDGDFNHLNYIIPVMDTGCQGNFRDEKTSYKFLMNSKRSSSGYNHFKNKLSDYYIERKLNENNSLILGQSRTPLGMEGDESDYTLITGRRSQISSNYSNIRALGAKLKGDYKDVGYNLGVFDTGRYLSNNFSSAPEFTGKLIYSPKSEKLKKYGKIRAATSCNLGKKDYEYQVYTAYLDYQYKKFFINAEYAIANGQNGMKNNPNKSSGFYTTLTYNFTPKLQGFARVDQFSPLRNNSTKDITEYTVGINYFLKQQKIRLIMSYSYTDYKTSQFGNKLFLMTQFVL